MLAAQAAVLAKFDFTAWLAGLTWLGWGLAALQTTVAVGFIAVLRRSRRLIAADEACPSALIVLCLRGADPFLRRCLLGLLTQDYPRFKILIVVDHRDDPAWRQAEEIAGPALGTRVEMQELRERPETCSLKNAALMQAYRGLPAEVDVVATIDADCTPHPTWLRELVEPLGDPRVGATTGNRWYMPDSADWGGLVRYLWNAAAVVPMFWHKIAWGGSLAVRASFVRSSDYVERMSRTLCEDTMLADVLRRAGLKLRFVPSLIMVNRESCDLGGYFRFCRRQMLIVRYHKDVWLIWGHGLVSSAYFIAAALTCLGGACRGYGAALAPAVVAFAAYLASMFGLLAPMEQAVRRIVRSRGEPVDWLSPDKLLRLPAALLLTQTVYGAIAWSLPLAKRVDWRGIRYTFVGRNALRRENYEPYGGTRDDSSATHSL